MSKEATKRIQFLDYNLMRSGQFNTNELALLNVISTFSDRCEHKQSDLAKALNKSIPTIRRTVNSLIKKGIIRRSYTLFKRCVLRIVSLKEQAQLKGFSMIKKALNIGKKRSKKIIKSSDRSPMSELIRSPMSEPTRSETKEIKQNNIVNFSENSFSLKPIYQSLEDKKNEMLARFKENEAKYAK